MINAMSFVLAELATSLACRIALQFGKSKAERGPDNQAPSEGRWVVREDRFCSQWPSAPAWVCYDMLRDGDVVVFVSEENEEWTARIAGGN